MSRTGRPSLNFFRRPAALRLVAVLLLALALAGCGRKAAPQPPPNEPTTYPRGYPNA